MADQPPIGEYRPGNCSPLTIWLEPPGGPNIHVGMASSPAWTARIIRGLKLLAAKEADLAKPCPTCADGTLCDRHYNAWLDRETAETDRLLDLQETCKCQPPDLTQMGNPVSYPHGMTWTCPACGAESVLIREGPLAMPTWRRSAEL